MNKTLILLLLLICGVVTAEIILPPTGGGGGQQGPPGSATNAQPPNASLTNLADNGFTTVSNANILYVDINGNNTTAKKGRPDKPWREVTNAVNSATSGDTILIGPGRWTNNTTMLLGDRVSMVGSGQGVTVITNTVDLGSGGVGLQPGMNNSYIGFLSVHSGDPGDEVLRGPLGAGDAGVGAARGFTNSVWESLDIMGWSDAIFVQNTNRCTWRAINCRFRSNVDIIVQARTNHVGEYVGCTFLTTSTSAGVGEFHPITIHAGISYFVNSLIVSSNGSFHRSVVVEPDAFAHFHNTSIPIALPGDHQITNTGTVFFSDPSSYDPVKMVGGGTYTAGNSNVTYLGNVSVVDAAYAAGWNGSLKVPTQNAVYDKIESLILAAGGTNFPAAIISTNLITGQATASGNTINALRGDYQIVTLGSHTNMNYVPYPGQESNVWTTVMFTQNSTGGYYPTNNGVTLYIPTNANAVGFARYGVYNGVTNVEVAVSMVMTNPIGGQTVLYDGTNGVFRNSTSPTGTGDMFGPASVTDKEIVLFGGTDGNRTTNSGVFISGTGNKGIYVNSGSLLFGVNGATNWSIYGSFQAGSLIPLASNAFDIGARDLPPRTNHGVQFWAKDLIQVEGNGSNGIVQLATSLTIPDHMTNVFGFDRVTQTYFIKIPNTNVTINGNTEDYAPLVFNPQTFTITNGAPVWQVGVTNDTIAIRPMVGLANSRSYRESRLLGVATMDISAGSYGWITTKGSVNGINLLALAPGGLNTNDHLYLNSVSGTYTTNNNPMSILTNYNVYVGQAVSTNILLVKDAPDPVYDRPLYARAIVVDATPSSVWTVTPPNNSTILIQGYLIAATGTLAVSNVANKYTFETLVATTNNTTRIVATSGAAINVQEDIANNHSFITNQSSSTVALRFIGVANTSNDCRFFFNVKTVPDFPLN